MKTRCEKFSIIGSITLLLVVMFILSGCNPKQKRPGLNDKNSAELKTGHVSPKIVKGGKYPFVKPDLKRLLNEEEKPYIVPNGPDVGRLKPENKLFKIKKNPGGGGTQQSVDFSSYNELKDATPIAHLTCPEPSVAENGQTIMTTGNFWMSLSKDGGNTYTTVSPTTIFPEDYGGFCCDQVLQYIPRYDLFVWLLQYSGDANGVNAIRIAVQNTQEVRNSNGTSWTYWDFTNRTFASSGGIDYNDMSFGDDNLYWCSSVGGGQNRYVIRIPLKELSAKGTVNFQYTGSTQAFWSHVTQNGTNGVYWAGHKNNSTMIVYSMMDADGFYSWRDVNINSWPNATMSSIAADGTDWLLDASWKTYVRAAAVHGNRIFFAWNASKGGDFPQPHIQIVAINKNTFVKENQMQIWNPDFAFAYPYFEVNKEGQLGMIVGFGGGPFDASSGVGVWGDFVIYCPRFSDMSYDCYGHYHTVRRSGSAGMQWVGAGYSHKADGKVLPYYVMFSH